MSSDLRQPVRLSLVTPCHNEKACITPFLARITQVFADLPEVTLELVFVNDGSTDSTLKRLREAMSTDSRIVIVDLSRNFGKEAALSAGLEVASGDAVVPLDADLQDPPELIPAMLARWAEGYDVVLAHRANRDTDSWLKRSTAQWFYRLHNIFASVPLPDDVGDFRLMDRRVVEALHLLPESCRFMKGIFAWLGFRTTSIDYVRAPRKAGETKFKAWRLWNFALDGITSFSTVPLRIWTYLGLFCTAVTSLLALRILIRTLFFGVDVPGYASIIVAIVFLGGLQLTGIGILGEYLGRTYLEAKRRPLYIIRTIYRPEPRPAICRVPLPKRYGKLKKRPIPGVPPSVPDAGKALPCARQRRDCGLHYPAAPLPRARSPHDRHVSHVARTSGIRLP